MADKIKNFKKMTKEGLIKYLINTGVLKTPVIIEAFEKVDRKDFILSEFSSEAYGDFPLSIGYGQTISQPSTVAFMLELLNPNEGEKVLDVGTGSAWTVALLASIVGPKGKVFGVEKIEELVLFGKSNLAKYNFKNIQLRLATGILGWPEEAPFDKILVSASAEELPEALVRQLKVEGQMVVPVKDSVWLIEKKRSRSITKTEFPGFVFVPLKK